MASISVSDTSLQRKQILLTEARRKRSAWVEEARDGSGGDIALSKGTVEVSSTATARKDVALELLLDSGVTLSLPSSGKVLDFLTDTVLDAGTDASSLVDTPIGTMEASEIPVPTYERMPGATPYEVFLAKLKHPSASEVVKSLERFISQMEKVDVCSLWEPMDHSISNMDEDGPVGGCWKQEVAQSSRPPVLIRTFLDRLARQMRDCPLWCPAMESVGDGSWDNALQSVESFLHRKLRHCLFGVTPDDIERDRAIDERIDSLGFLEAKHLDIHALQKNGAAVDWSVAVNHLQNMEKESGPSAKMDKIVKCSKEITQVLTIAMGGELPGADDFLPAMILVLKLAKPRQLQSTLTFIQEYCPENKLISEAGYIFTHLSSALSFLMDVDASQLTIDPLMFEQELQKHKQKTLTSANMAYNSTTATNLVVASGGERSETDDKDVYRELSIREMRALLKKDTRISLTKQKEKKRSKHNPFAKQTENQVQQQQELSSMKTSMESMSLNKTTATVYNPFLPPSAIAPCPVKASEVRSKYTFLDHQSADSLTLKQAGELLSEYRDLVGFCESLLVEREEARKLYIQHLQKENTSQATL